MPFATFTPVIQPGQNATYNETARMLSNTFGDNYKQDMPDGINYILGTAQLVWPSISAANWATMVAFFQAHVAVPFYWTLPDETTPRKWTVDAATGWKKGWGSPLWLTNCTVSFLISSVPDPG